MDTPDTKPNCPVCGQKDQVFKVSQLYLLARENKQKSEPFAPPSGKTEMTRLVHPDMAVGVLTLIAIFFMVKIVQEQPNMILPAVIALVLFYAGYIGFHKVILNRYQAQRNKENLVKVNVEAAVGEWMKLYYCAREKGVFDPQEGDLVPLDQMRMYVSKKAVEK